MDAAKRWFAVHRKLVTFLAGSVLTICIQVFGTDNPYVSLGILVATGLGIYGVPNQAPPAAPPARAEKTLIPPTPPAAPE